MLPSAILTKLKFVEIIVLTLCASCWVLCPARAQDNKQAGNLSIESRLEQLSKGTMIQRSDLMPWHLVLSWKLQSLEGRSQDEGTTEAWYDGKTVKTMVTSRVVNGPLPAIAKIADVPTTREVYLLQRLLDEVIHPVQHSKALRNVHMTDQRQTFGKAQLDCIRVYTDEARKADLSFGYSYCTETGDPNVLRVHMDNSSSAIRNRLGRFQGVNVAMNIEILYAGKIAISGTVEKLVTYVPEPVAKEDVAQDVAPATRGTVLAGHKLRGRNPEYPFLARQEHISGTVVLSALIDEAGRIERLTPIASPDGSLTASALDAVKTWEYEPYLLNGKPTSVDTVISVNYNNH